METVTIETSQNVDVQYEVATIVDRGLAVVVDWCILVGYTIAVTMTSDELGLHPPEWLQLLLLGLPWTFYHLVSETLMDGQSLGKRALNIKVVRIDGGQAGLGNYLLRWILRMIDALFLLGAVVILFNGKGQRLGDIAAGTAVISLKKRTQLSDTLMMDLPEGHVVTFPESQRLTDAHARLLKEVLASTSGARPMAIVQLSTRLREELSITSELQPEEFLRTLLADHIFLTAR